MYLAKPVRVHNGWIKIGSLVMTTVINHVIQIIDSVWVDKDWLF